MTGPTALPLESLEDLAGQQIYVRRSSSYLEPENLLGSKGLRRILPRRAPRRNVAGDERHEERHRHHGVRQEIGRTHVEE